MRKTQTLSETRDDSIWFPESILAAWLAVAVVMLTTSLLFYDITGRKRSKSVFRSKTAAKIVAIGLMVLSIVLTAGATNHYYARITEIDPAQLTESQLRREHGYKVVYTAVGGAFVIIEFIVAWMVFRGIDEGR